MAVACSGRFGEQLKRGHPQIKDEDLWPPLSVRKDSPTRILYRPFGPGPPRARGSHHPGASQIATSPRTTGCSPTAKFRSLNLMQCPNSDVIRSTRRFPQSRADRKSPYNRRVEPWRTNHQENVVRTDSEKIGKKRRRARQVVDDVWRLFVLVRAVLRTARLPVNFPIAINILGQFTKLFSRKIENLRRPKQIPRFQDVLSTEQRL
jgi:hypothetical protein